MVPKFLRLSFFRFVFVGIENFNFKKLSSLSSRKLSPQHCCGFQFLLSILFALSFSPPAASLHPWPLSTEKRVNNKKRTNNFWRNEKSILVFVQTPKPHSFSHPQIQILSFLFALAPSPSTVINCRAWLSIKNNMENCWLFKTDFTASRLSRKCENRYWSFVLLTGGSRRRPASKSRARIMFDLKITTKRNVHFLLMLVLSKDALEDRGKQASVLVFIYETLSAMVILINYATRV